MQVNITSDGRLQLVEGTMVFPPLTQEEVAALANAIPALQVVTDAYPLSSAIDDIAYGLKEIPAPATTVTFADGLVTVTTSDQDTFAAVADGMDVVLGPGTTTFTKGPATVTKTGA